MFKVLKNHQIAENTFLAEVEAERIASEYKAGQFIIIRVWEKGERIPLTIADADPERGTITIVYLRIGASTIRLSKLKPGDFIADILGPLGNPSQISHFGKVIAVGGGVGIAALYPILKELKNHGNKITSIIGARSKSLLFWEDKIGNVSDHLIITTDDGSYGRKGLVTIPLKELLESDSYNRVIAIGPVPMMAAIADLTKRFGVKTVVSLNSIMVDGTGMCGTCRVSVGGCIKFTCVDGPEFDAHLIDFKEFSNRLKMYRNEEAMLVRRLSGR